MKHLLFFLLFCIIHANSNQFLYAQSFHSEGSELHGTHPPEIKEMHVSSNQVLIELEKNDSCLVQIFNWRLIESEDWLESNFKGTNAFVNQLAPNSKYEMMITAIYPNNVISSPLGFCFITKE